MATHGRKSPVKFIEPDSTIRDLPRRPPQKRARQEIVNDPAARTIVADAVAAGRKAWMQPKCQSNAELIERIDSYFELIQGRQLPPSIEELSLYCGVHPSTFRNWRNGNRTPFHDAPYPGCSTQDIAEKASAALGVIDVALANVGKVNVVWSIFRQKAIYGLQDHSEIVIKTDASNSQEMTREQIAEFARNLPDCDYGNMDIE